MYTFVVPFMSITQATKKFLDEHESGC